MSNLVSVVIPVYNGEKWIERCVRSVLGQTYPDLEVIVVDDGSKDRSGVICDRLASEDSRMKVFHQENGGVNSARLKGVNEASGDWLMFVDADDTIPENAVERYMTFADGCDVVVSKYSRDCILDKETYARNLLTGDILPGVCCKFFSMKCYRANQPVLDRKLAMGEDMLINLVVSLNVGKVRCVTDNLYIINTNNSDSVTRVFKRTWEYEKMYFRALRAMFLDKARSMGNFDELDMLVRKSQLNGIKYLMLDGNKVAYDDADFVALESYFKGKKNCLGPSEKLIFMLKNGRVYRLVLKVYMSLMKFL